MFTGDEVSCFDPFGASLTIRDKCGKIRIGLDYQGIDKEIAILRKYSAREFAESLLDLVDKLAD